MELLPKSEELSDCSVQIYPAARTICLVQAEVK